MKESIKALLGISVVDSLENDLRRILSKNIRLAQEGSDEHKLAELKSEKDAAEENLEKTDEEIANIQQQVDCETKALESKRAEYSSIGGDIVSQRQEMLHQKTVLTMQLDQINEDLITDASGDLPLALVQNLLWKIKGQAETAQNDKLNRLAIERINDFLRHIRLRVPQTNRMPVSLSNLSQSSTQPVKHKASTCQILQPINCGNCCVKS